LGLSEVGFGFVETDAFFLSFPEAAAFAVFPAIFAGGGFPCEIDIKDFDLFICDAHALEIGGQPLFHLTGIADTGLFCLNEQFFSLGAGEENVVIGHPVDIALGQVEVGSQGSGFLRLTHKRTEEYENE
jgi:hypothetical protein